LISLSIDVRHSWPHFDVANNIRKSIMKKMKKIPKDMLILCIVAKKWKVATLRE